MKQTLYKSALWAAMAAAMVACQKENIPSTPVGDGAEISLTFDSPVESRAFGAGTTETWEKEVKSATLLVFNAAGVQLLNRSLTAAQVTGSSATPITLALPNVSTGDACDFYVIINRAVDASVTTKTALLALLESDVASYNGIYSDIMSKAGRQGGFVMTGMSSVNIASGTTAVAITVKRVVAKVEVQCATTATFAANYGNAAIRIKSVKISNVPGNSYLIDQSSSKYATTGTPYSFTQVPYLDSSGASKAQNYKYNNFFYINEKATAAVGSRVKLTIEAVYDADGNLGTNTDQIPVTYEAEITGTSGGRIARNGSYLVNARIDGITGEDITLSVTLANWETLVSENLNVGS